MLVSLLLFRSYSFSSSIADADADSTNAPAPAVAVVDPSTTVVATIPAIDLAERRNYDKLIGLRPMVLIDQFFLDVSKAKRLGVPPLLRTKAAIRLLHCNNNIGCYVFCLSIVKLLWAQP